ncbi:hypothetical protein NL341_27430, partial [Klebsiella pneumoniae]|nr:hypothetical protein [Klebsiella pneumoniae]
SEKLREIEIQQRSDIEKFLDTYLIDQCNCELVDFYLNRLFGEVKKTEVIKRILNSSNKGALLCVSYLKKGSVGTAASSLKFEICR